MTTDTFQGRATVTVKLGKAKVTINGMAKGAGMIALDMATMLSFIFTDAPIAPAALQALLKSGVEDTFNAVTIDGDTRPRTCRCAGQRHDFDARDVLDRIQVLLAEGALAGHHDLHDVSLLFDVRPGQAGTRAGSGSGVTTRWPTAVLEAGTW